jgi:hypothetical protein
LHSRARRYGSGFRFGDVRPAGIDPQRHRPPRRRVARATTERYSLLSVPSVEALSTYRFQGKLERAIREEWIRPLLEHLGYGIDTLNDVLYEERLTLRNNRRKIGSETRMVDYVPTVLGHGLWIIEAKAPEARDPWDDALSQAWLYATHPEVDVPLMAIADGSRFAVYEVNRIDWDVALLDLTIDQLVARFDELVHVLGAAHVAETIRTRQLRHLEQAMRAELDPVRLDETVAAVREIADRARPVVLKNRGRVLLDQFERVAQGTDETIRSVGLWGIAQIHNQPIPNNLSPDLSLTPTPRFGRGV